MSSNLDTLRPYTPIVVNIQGQVGFSHISKMYEGEELIAANKKAQEHGGRPSSRPYCTITIDNPRILNPETLPADVVQVMQERFKASKSNVVKYYATSKSQNLPPVAYSVYAGPGLAGQGIADKMHPLAHELDTGLTVTIGAKIFNTMAGVGVGIDYVLIDEPIRYYEPNSLADALASQGVTYVAPNSNMNAAQNVPSPQPFSKNAAVDSGVYETDGFMNIPDVIDDMPQFDVPDGIDEELPFGDPSACYGANNTVPVAATMQNTASPNSRNNNRAAQNVRSVNAQMQGTAVYKGAAQNVRSANAQMNQAGARPRVRMDGMPAYQQQAARQPQNRAAAKPGMEIYSA